MNLSAQTLILATGAASRTAPQFADAVNEAADLFELRTLNRMGDFLAQVGHECLGFALLRELWGPKQVPEQQTYERDFSQPWGPSLKRGDRNFKAYTLGNEMQGDGYRFRGGGGIQTTGRGGYIKARERLRVFLGLDVPDFEVDPDAITVPRWAVLTSGLFWRDNRLNAYADTGDFRGQTIVINGATNGWDDRNARRSKARNALTAAGWV